MPGNGSRGLWVLGGNPFVLLVQRSGSLETYVDGRRLPTGAFPGLGLAVSSNPRVAYAVKQSSVGLLEGGLYRSETAGVWTWLGDSDLSISQFSDRSECAVHDVCA